jgi:hypothetical protein
MSRWERWRRGRAPGPEAAEREELRRLDDALRRLPRIEPSPQFEARFRARLARAEAETAAGLRARLARLLRPGARPWLGAAGVAATAVLVWLWLPAGTDLSEKDWALLADAEGFDLVLEVDPELLATLEVLEAWEAEEGS